MQIIEFQAVKKQSRELAEWGEYFCNPRYKCFAIVFSSAPNPLCLAQVLPKIDVAVFSLFCSTPHLTGSLTPVFLCRFTVHLVLSYF